MLVASACLVVGAGAAVTAAIWARDADGPERETRQPEAGTAPGRASIPPAEVVVGSARYPEYRDLRQLAAASSLIVRGRVVRVLPSYREVPPGFEPRKIPPALRPVAGIVKTDVIVQVTSTIRGRPVRRVRVAHLGGRIGGVRVVMEGEPISRLGRSYVFFLRRGGKGRYDIVGGGQGRYAIRGGRLTLVADDFALAPVVRALRGMRATTFEREFQALLRARPSGQRVGDLPHPEERLGRVPATDKPPSPPRRPPRP